MITNSFIYFDTENSDYDNPLIYQMLNYVRKLMELYNYYYYSIIAIDNHSLFYMQISFL